MPAIAVHVGEVTFPIQFIVVWVGGGLAATGGPFVRWQLDGGRLT
jgi:hypothetical protein